MNAIIGVCSTVRPRGGIQTKHNNRMNSDWQFRCASSPAGYAKRYCAKQAWRILRGGSPRRVRIGHPPVSSVAPVAKSIE